MHIWQTFKEIYQDKYTSPKNDEIKIKSEDITVREQQDFGTWIPEFQERRLCNAQYIPRKMETEFTWLRKFK